MIDGQAIAREVGRRLSFRLPPSGAVDREDVEQLALEAYLELEKTGQKFDCDAHLAKAIANRTVDALRRESALTRRRAGGEDRPVQIDVAILDAPRRDGRQREIASDDDFASDVVARLGRGDVDLKGALGVLSDRELELVRRRHVVGETQTVLAADWGITVSRVSQIEKRALEKLKKAVNPPKPTSKRPGPRELETLRLAALGLSADETAKRLRISLNTAKSHRAAVMRKLGARNMANAVALGFRVGLLV